MKIKQKKSGQSREKVSQRLLTAANEFGERAGKHFNERFVDRLPNIREVRLWVVEWVLLVLVVFLLAITQNIWYGESFETEAFVQGGEYSEATLGKVNSMNPLYATTSSEKTLAKLLFANLVAPDSTGHLKNELADTIKADETRRIWTVKLKDNLRWSDGESIKADDVLYTIDLINDSSAKTTVSVNFMNVKVEKKDDLTTVFTLPSSYTDFTDNLEFPIVPKHVLKDIKPALVYESDFSTNPIGSGPFVLNALQTSSGVANTNSQTVYLNRNEYYFKKNTRLDNFTLKTYEDAGQIIGAMQNADVMATAELTKEESEQLPGTVSRRNTLINGGAFAFLNTTSDKLNNVKVRQAIQRGVDMAKVREDIDDAQVLDYPILARQEQISMPELEKYDLDAAKKLITDAGLKYDEDKIIDNTGKQVTLNISVPQRETLAKVAERFRNQLKKLGFEVVLNVYDESKATSDFFSAVVRPRDYDILVYEIDLGVSADPFVYYSSSQAAGTGWNLSNYANSLADDALVVARTTTNAKLRKTKYESFMKLWVRDVPAIGLYQSTMTYNFMPNTYIYSENSELTDALDRFSEVQNWASRKASVNMTP
ncbi:hypothetical protein J6X15_02830 [Candidatus Saccharibacteria bacterium]|nr:hypothetical protein [Candidatus Saccharibacteria bacterium]